MDKIDDIEQILTNKKYLVSQVVRKYFLIGAGVDDLMQEGMIGLYKATLTFDNLKNANFDTYAKVCINRQIINLIKSYNSKRNLPLNSSLSLNTQGELVSDIENEETESTMVVAVSPFEPEQNMIEKENIKNIYKKIDKNLSIFEKNVLKLYLDGLSMMEISNKVDKPYKSVDNSLTRIKSKLRKVL